MRRPFQKLMEMVSTLDWEDSQITLGQLAEMWNEPVGRVMDAIDAWRVCCGEQTYIPAAAGDRSVP